jgi:hypothetical protein
VPQLKEAPHLFVRKAAMLPFWPAHSETSHPEIASSYASALKQGGHPAPSEVAALIQRDV